jgi:hypothetical protein
MDLLLLLLALIVIGVCAQLLINPASPARVRAFRERHGLTADLATDAYVTGALARSRRRRAVGVMVAAVLSGISTLPQSRFSVGFTWVLAGWLAGAILAEVTAPATTPSDHAAPSDHAVPVVTGVPTWLRRVPAGIAIGAVASTVITVLVRPSSVSGLRLAGWGGAALACALLVAWVVGRIVRRPGPVSDADRALRGSATAAITGVGTALAILYLLHQVSLLKAGILGEEADAMSQVSLLWTLGSVVLGLLIGSAGRPGRDTDGAIVRPSAVRKSVVLVVVGILVMATGAFVGRSAVKQHPPYGPSALHAHATIRITNDDDFGRDEAALGVTDLSTLDPGQGAQAFVGRVDFAIPTAAHKGGLYYVIVIDDRTNSAVSAIWGNGAGQGWAGALDVLPQRYSWLDALTPKDNGFGFISDPSAAMADPDKTGSLGIDGLVVDDGSVTAADLTVVLVFQGPDGQIYWATKVPTATA